MSPYTIPSARSASEAAVAGRFRATCDARVMSMAAHRSRGRLARRVNRPTFLRRLYAHGRYSVAMRIDWRGHAWALAAAAVATALGLLMTPRFDLVNVAMVYLAAGVLVALRH